MLPLEKSPASGGAKALTAPGGEGASIAQRYLLRSLQGQAPDPNAACGRKISGQSRRKENKCRRNTRFVYGCPRRKKSGWESSARACGLTRTAYLRRLLLGAEVKFRPSQEVKALRTEIHQIGNNINQIARSVNAGIATAEDARQGLCLLKRVYELMYRIANQ